MSRYEHGHVTNVEETDLGAALEADTPSGALELVVDNARDFDVRGGVVLLDGTQRRRYTGVDNQTRTLALARATGIDLAAGDTIAVWDRNRGAVAVQKTARVSLGDGMSDDIVAHVPHGMVDRLPAGPRTPGDEESVLLEKDGPTRWRIVDVLGVGDPDAALYRFGADSWIVETEGDQVFILSREPVESSVRVYINGDEVDAEDGWSIRGRRLSIDDALVQVGDEVVAEYAWDRHSEARWEADDTYTLTPADVTAGSFTFTLSHIPIDESVQAAWGGVTQPPTEYTVDTEGVVTWQLEGFEKAGDTFWFHYQYLVGAASDADGGGGGTPTLQPLTFAGVLTSRSTAPTTTLDLPEGTQIGDLVAVAMWRTDEADVTDARFRLVYRRSVQAAVWVCDAIDSLGPIAVNGAGDATDRNVMSVAVWSNTTGAGSSSAVEGTTQGAIPMPVPGGPSVCVLMGYSSGFDSAQFDDDDLDAGWNLERREGGRTALAWGQWDGVGATPVGGISTDAAAWSAVALDVTLAEA